MSVVADWKRGGFTVAAGYRHATGRPFTPIIGAEHDETEDRWIPAYGAPMSERFPPFKRLDLSLSHMRQWENGMMRVLFVSATNLLDRSNVQRYHYSPDYSVRYSTPGIMNRSVYFGATLGNQ
jgi:hypothetical protein